MIRHPTLIATNKDAANDELQQLHRLAELGRLSASLLHEISNPLTAALLNLDRFENNKSAEIRETKRNIQLLRRYVEAARRQIQQDTQLRHFKVNAQMSQLKRILLPLAKQANVRLIINKVPDCRLYGDSVKFQQVVANLIVNAIEAYANSNHDELKRLVTVNFYRRGKRLLIRVTDWGEGILPHQFSKLFEPFYTTKKKMTGHGLGIGLSLVRQYVVNDFGGSISVKGTRRHGTSFTISLSVTD